MDKDIHKSIWSEYAPHKAFETLNRNINTDVLIIGGGITGLLCAHMLKKSGVNCVLVEADRICSGITKNTTAKITLAHGLIYHKLIKRFGEEKARLYLQAQQQACDSYAELCREFPCDYLRKDSYVYSMENTQKIQDEIKALNRLGLKAEFSEARRLPFEVKGAVRVGGQAEFHPLKFAFSMAENLPIYENTKVIENLPHKAITQHGEISYEKMIVASHFPIINKHGGYFIKMYQHRSYVVALKGAPNVEGMYVDESDTGLSFRNYKDLLLIGGGGHRTGKKGGCWQELEKFAQKYYKDGTIVGRWATQDCITLDGVPYIGQYSKNTPDLFVATGFNKWGITSAMVSADILCDLVQGKDNRFAEVFSPSRSVLRPQIIVNSFESVVGLITPTTPRCPHLGCALKYNREEHSWDCPCHGSRFTQKGELIDNPATDDKRL